MVFNMLTVAVSLYRSLPLSGLSCYCTIQKSLYFKANHGTKKMWSYIAGGLKIKTIQHRKLPFGTKSSRLIIKDGLKIEDCK